MKILLAYSPDRLVHKRGEEEGAIYPPLGIMYIASYLRGKISDVNVSLLDAATLTPQEFVQGVKQIDPDILGLSFPTMSARAAFVSSRLIKSELPHVPIIGGGPHATAMPRQCIEEGNMDVVVIGEGEITFTELVQAFRKKFLFKKESLKDVKGIAFKYGNEIFMTPPRVFIRNLDEIPFPARDLMDILDYPGYHYVKRIPDTEILSSRGCPWTCTFCANCVWRVSAPRVRLRSPQNIVDELEEIMNKYKIKEVFDYCDEFNALPKWSIEVCREIQKRRLDLSWKTALRVDRVTDELARELSNSGLWLALIGIESANVETLKGTKKGTTPDQAVKACSILKKHGIKILGYFMSFNVWEENGFLKYEDIEMSMKTYKLAKNLVDKKLLDYLTFSITTPWPGSELYNIARRHGLISEYNYDQWTAHEVVMNLPGVSQQDIKKLKSKSIMLQAKCLLLNGGINPRLMSFYLRKAFKAIGWRVSP